MISRLLLSAFYPVLAGLAFSLDIKDVPMARSVVVASIVWGPVDAWLPLHLTLRIVPNSSHLSRIRGPDTFEQFE